MGRISDIFEKIIVDGQEIELSSLVLLNGNLNIGYQKDVNVEYIFKDESKIPSGLFKNLKQLKYAYFPEAGNIKTIGERAFANSNLSYINNLSDVNYIGAQAFSYTKLTYVYNGDAPSSIAANAWSFINTLDNDFKETLRRKYPYIDFGTNNEVEPSNPGEGGEQGGEHGGEQGGEQGEEEITSYNYTIINCDFNNNETLFVQQKDASGTTRSTITNSDNVLVITGNANCYRGNACAKYDFSNFINENTYKVQIEFDLKLSNELPTNHNIFTFGDINLRAQTIQEYNNSGSIFNIGIKREKWAGKGDNIKIFIINNQQIKNENQDGYEKLVDNWLHIIITTNLRNKKVSYKIINKNNAEILYQESNINYLDENANILNVIDYDARSINALINYIDNLVISKETYTKEENQPSGGEQGGEGDSQEDTYVDNHNYQYYEEYTKTNINGNVTVAIGIDNSHINLIESGIIGLNESENNLTKHNPNILIGDLNNTMVYGTSTTPVSLTNGNKAIFRFTNYSSKQNVWNNFIVFVGNEIFDINNILIGLRADKWELVSQSNTEITNNYDNQLLEAFNNYLDGAYVKVTVQYENNTINIRCDIEPNQNQQSGDDQGGGQSSGGQDSGDDTQSSIIYTDIINVPFNNQEILFEKTAGSDNKIRISSIENINIDGNNVIAFINDSGANNNGGGSAIGVYNFGYLLTNYDKLYKVQFDIKLSDDTPQSYNMFSIGDIYYKVHEALNYNNSGVIFNIGTRRGKWNGTGAAVNYFTINNQYLKYSTQDGYDKLVNNWLHIEVEIDLTNRILNYKVKSRDLNETLYEGQNVGFVDQTNNITLNEIDYDSRIGNLPGNNDLTNYLDNLIISKGDASNIQKENVTLSFAEQTINIEGNVGDEIILQQATCSLNNATITYTVQSNGSIDETNGKYYIYQSGQATVIVNYAGDTTHNPATAQYTLNITAIIPKENVTLSFAEQTVEVEGNVGDTVTLQQATCSVQDAEITYTLDSNDVITENAGVYTIAQSGQVTITANYAGDATHNPATAQYTITVTAIVPKENVTLSFVEQTVEVEGNVGDTVTLQQATCSVQNAEITYTLDPNDVITENAGVYTIAQSGQVTITANYAGDATHNPTTAQYILNVSIVEDEYVDDHNYQYYEEYTKENINGNVKVSIATDHSHIDLIESGILRLNESENHLTLHDPNITIGNVDNTTEHISEGSYTTPLTLSPNRKAIFKFKNYSGRERYEHNFYVFVGDEQFNIRQLLIALRADRWENVTYRGNDAEIPNNYNWNTFVNDLDGAYVKVTITYENNTINIRCDIEPAIKEDITLSFTNETVNIEGEVGEETQLQEVNCSLTGAKITYGFDINDVIEEENGRYIIAKSGSVIVTARYMGDATHNPATAQYILNVSIVEDEYVDDHNYQYYEEYTKENINGNVKVSIATDHSHIDLIESGILRLNESENHLTLHDPNITIGNVDNTTEHISEGSYTTPLTLSPNRKAIFKFTNYSGRARYEHNFYVFVGDEQFNIRQLLIALRADRWENVTWGGDDTKIPNNYNWNTFVDDLDGAYVKVTITYENNTINIRCDIEPAQTPEPEEPEPQTYTITFKDGNEILKTITGPTGTSISASDINLIKEGYDFDGWSIDGTSPILPVDEITDSDITYIALWVKTYTVTFKDGDDVISTVTGVTGTVVETPTNPTKEGYTFSGWSTDGSTVITPITNIGENDVIYIAVWEEIQPEPEEPEPQTYTVTFKDGDDVISTVTGVTGTVVETPANPTKEGYTFSGWSTDGSTVIIPIANIGENDVIYIAVWEEIQPEPEEPEPQTYTVTFKDGDDVISTVTGVTGTTVETPTNPTKEGYTFSGWSTDGSTVITPITNIGENDVIYIAVWEEIQPEPPETYIVNTSFNDNESLFEIANGVDGNPHINIGISEIDNNNVVVFTNQSKSDLYKTNAVGIYDFSQLVSNDDTKYKVQFDIKLTSAQPTFSNMFVLGDINYRERTGGSLNTNGVIFSIGTKRSKITVNGTYTNYNYFAINEQYILAQDENGYNQLVDNWLHVEVEIDLTNKTLNYLVQTQDLTETLYEAQNINFLDQTNNVTLNEIDYDSSINGGINYLDNLVISKITE